MVYWDNRSEFSSQVMDLSAYQNGVRIDFSRPGKPTDNAYIETVNGTLRAECLDARWLGTLAEPFQQGIEPLSQTHVRISAFHQFIVKPRCH